MAGETAPGAVPGPFPAGNGPADADPPLHPAGPRGGGSPSLGGPPPPSGAGRGGGEVRLRLARLGPRGPAAGGARVSRGP